MSDQLRQNRYCLFGRRAKGSILGVMLLVFILPAPSGSIGGASPAQAQTKSRFPPFQLVINQRYSHPVYPELRIEIDNRLLLITGLPPPMDCPCPLSFLNFQKINGYNFEPPARNRFQWLSCVVAVTLCGDAM